MKTVSLLIFFTTFYLFANSQECHESGNQPHAMAPIGIMGGHTHPKGHLMMSYRYMSMDMRGVGMHGQQFPSEEILQHYMMAPENMHMQMHMVGIMYSVSDRVTLNAMSNFHVNSMEMVSSRGHAAENHHHHGEVSETANPVLEKSIMNSRGMGDTRIGALVRLNMDPKRCFHALGGIQLPTGSTEIKSGTNRMSYPMQTGTGSIAAYGGLNFSWLMDNYLIGAQAMAFAPLHKNRIGYQKSNKYDLSIWASRKITSWMGTGLRLHGMQQTAILGHDPHLDLMMSPASNGQNEALSYCEALAGVNFKPANKIRAALECGLPFYQWNEGHHLNQGLVVHAGLQVSLN